jgi:hypothetical protein
MMYKFMELIEKEYILTWNNNTGDDYEEVSTTRDDLVSRMHIPRLRKPSSGQDR